ncbi:MAG: hypothetical protein EBU90_28615 [Proteobacteria bacterium]|nr:hypothetical protein [Pseudomonadota bacterium]
MTLVALVLRAEKVVILAMKLALADEYILIKVEVMAAMIEQIKIIPQVVAILQEIVVAKVEKEEGQVADLVALIGKVEVAKIPHIQANNILINL